MIGEGRHVAVGGETVRDDDEMRIIQHIWIYGSHHELDDQR